MRVTIWMRTAGVLVVLGLGAYGAMAQQDSTATPATSNDDSVAAAARKAKEQKKDEPKAKKVFTDDDVKPAAPEAPPPAVKADGQAASDGTASGEKEDPNGEKAWRKRFKQQHDKISQAEQELDILQRELDKNQVQYYADPQKALSEQTTRKDVNDKTVEVDAKKKEIAQLKQQLSDMEDDLRKSGGDPGWARE